jgi:hypothetical protein
MSQGPNITPSMQGAPGIFQGVARAGMGDHAYKAEGEDENGNEVVGYGCNSEEAEKDY